MRAWLGVRVWGRSAVVAALRYAGALQFQEKSYDVVHCHFGPNGLNALAMRQAGFLRGKIVVAFHGYDLSSYVRETGMEVYADLFRDVDMCLPVTERWRERLIELGCPPEKIRVHHMGVDCERLAWASRRLSDPPTVITIARLVEKKGINNGIRAIAEVLKWRSVAYVIVGDGPERPRLERLIAELGVSQHVLLLGWQDGETVRSLLYEADIALLPSVRAGNGDEEGLPVSIMEAMATGLPVVSTLHSGIPELIQDGVEGFLVEERNVPALTDRLTVLLDQPERRVRMGKAARARVEQSHNQRTLNDDLLTVYRQVLEKESGDSWKRQSVTAP